MLADNDYLIGSAARISVAIADTLDAALDPAALRLKTRSPTGMVTTYSYGTDPDIVKDAVGRYHADIALTEFGQWLWRWETDAPYAGATEGTLAVRASRFRTAP